MKRPQRWLQAHMTASGRTHWSLTDHAHKILTYWCLGIAGVFFTISVTWAVISCVLFKDCGVGQRYTQTQASDSDPHIRQWQRQQQQIEEFREQLRKQQQQEKQ